MTTRLVFVETSEGEATPLRSLSCETSEADTSSADVFSFSIELIDGRLTRQTNHAHSFSCMNVRDTCGHYDERGGARKSHEV